MTPLCEPEPFAVPLIDRLAGPPTTQTVSRSLAPIQRRIDDASPPALTGPQEDAKKTSRNLLDATGEI
jgi:hypothetical protein